MSHFTRDQQLILDNFTHNCQFLISSGFAYAKAHPEYIPSLECEKMKIEAIKRNMSDNACSYKMMKDAYIQYMVKLTKLALKSVTQNPSYYDEILKVQNVLSQVDKLKSGNNNKAYTPSSDVDEEAFTEIYQEIENINRKISIIQNKTFNLTRPKIASLKRTSDCLKKLGRHLDKKLDDLQQARKLRQQKFVEMQKDNDDDDDKSVTMSPKESEMYDASENSNDDDESSSEVLIDRENYQAKPSPKVNRIEKRIYIPIRRNDKPRANMRKNDNGMMKLNLRLDFGERVLYNDRLVKSINIQNLLVNRK